MQAQERISGHKIPYCILSDWSARCLNATPMSPRSPGESIPGRGNASRKGTTELGGTTSLSRSTTARIGMVTFSGAAVFPLMRSVPRMNRSSRKRSTNIGEERGRHRLLIESSALDQEMRARSWSFLVSQTPGVGLTSAGSVACATLGDNTRKQSRETTTTRCARKWR